MNPRNIRGDASGVRDQPVKWTGDEISRVGKMAEPPDNAYQMLVIIVLCETGATFGRRAPGGFIGRAVLKADSGGREASVFK